MSREEWVWCGYPGHFIAAESCRMHLHTRVGDYRISTVGDYWVNGEQHDIGFGRKFETFVFRVAGDGFHGEGEVEDWSEIASEGYNDMVDAERGHIAMCERYDRAAAGKVA